MDYREIWKAHYVRIMHLQRFLQRIIKVFRQKKKNLSKIIIVHSCISIEKTQNIDSILEKE